jgi:hypothetical protein
MNGYARFLGLVLAGIFALSGWTLFTVNQQGKQIAKVESNEEWMKTILTEMSHRLNESDK